MEKFKNNGWLFMLTALFALGASQAWGQLPAARGKRPAPPPRPDRFEMMRKRLSLTDGQAARIKELFQGEEAEMKRIRGKIKDESEFLQKKMEQKAPDPDIQSSVDILMGYQDQIQESQKKVRAAMKTILTPVQQAKLVLGGRANPANNRPSLGTGPLNAHQRHPRTAANGQKPNQPGATSSAPGQSSTVK